MRIWRLMLLTDSTLASILLTTLYIVLLIVPKCYAFMCTGIVDKNVLKHVDLVEKKTGKGVKHKAKDD